MATTTGRSSYARTVAGVGTTNASTALTGAAGSFFFADVGAPVSGTNIPAGATIASVASGTSAALSVNATGTGSVTATIGPRLPSSAGFTGCVPEVESRAFDYTFASNASGVVPLDRISDPFTRAGAGPVEQ